VVFQFVDGFEAKSGFVTTNQFADQIFAWLTQFNIWREFEKSFEVFDFLACLAGGVGKKRWESADHFIEDDPDTPIVDGFVLSVLHEDFGRNLVGGAHGGLGHRAFVVLGVDHVLGQRQLPFTHHVLHFVLDFVVHVHILAQPEVDQFYVACTVDQNVVGLDVSVDLIEPVNLLHRCYQLCRLESRHVFLEDIQFYQQIHQISALDKLSDEV